MKRLSDIQPTMTHIIGVDEIGQCRSGPHNDIDLQAVYGGRILGRSPLMGKVNPVYNDTGGQVVDVNRNTALHVFTYETFPRTKEREMTDIRNGSPRNGESHSPKMNGFGKNGHITNGNTDLMTYSDHNSTLTDVNRNKLTFTRSLNIYSDTGQDSSMEGDTRHLPGDNHDHIKGSFQLLEPVGKINQTTELKNAHNEQFLGDTISESCKTSQNTCEILGPTNIKVEIEPYNDSDYSKIDIRNKSKLSGSLKLLGYNNAGFENEEPSQTNVCKASFENRENCKRDDVPREFSNGNSHIINKSGLVIITNDNPIVSDDDGEEKEPVEIVTEVIVHSVPEHSVGLRRKAPKYSDVDRVCHSIDTDVNDWPDLGSLVRGGEIKEDVGTDFGRTARNWDGDLDTGCTDIGVREVHGRASSMPDNEHFTGDSGYETIAYVHETDNDLDDQIIDETREKESKYKKNTKSKSAKVSSKGSSANDGSTRTLKSILSNSMSASQCSCSQHSDSRHSDSDSEIQEMKSVKFSQDTVFNENKNSKYKQERIARINLREIYHGKIVSETAMAKMNPLFTDEEGKTGSITDDEKLAYKTALKQAMALSKAKGEGLNQPSYMEQYLILKAHGLKAGDDDIEQLPEWMEKPAYDRLIQRTLAKERRKCVVKWTLVLVTVFIITAVATVLGIHFQEGFS
ncbi:uncharacterized protein LOC128226850 [Mya arenaria]|uniref:uncharacterized protein LOC128226850 n=1 Tax=Mya arenaria TaxID=6604 RepID=UPI0022E30BA4|nr:uncharacterized protein LOC128226850 [Mya arenaria]XP_052792890.1 uncharacterized protein LOC128226850 [Mya arenaria]